VLNNPLRYADPTGDDFWGSLETYFSNPMNIGEFIMSVAACGLAGPVGCAIVGAEIVLLNVGVALMQGASFDQTALNLAIGIGIGVLTSGVVSGILGPGANPIWGIIAGSASAAGATAISDVIANKSVGWDVFWAAAISAAQGAAGLGLQRVGALSQASAQGGDKTWLETEDPRYMHHTATFTDNATGMEQAYDPESSGLGFLKTGESPYLDSDNDWHRLTGTFKGLLASYGAVGVDLDAILVNPTVDLPGLDGFTLGNHVWLDNGESPAYEGYTLGHELAHSAQVALLGPVVFAIRYGVEWLVTGGNPYGDVPGGPVESFDPAGRDYYLDQAGDHMRNQTFPYQPQR
jgi:hypothetical protein